MFGASLARPAPMLAAPKGRPSIARGVSPGYTVPTNRSEPQRGGRRFPDASGAAPMKRDMDLVRKIVFALEEHEHGHAPRSFRIEGYDEEMVGYHVHLMMQAGLVKGADTTHLGSTSPSAIPIALKWEGHEFADAARSDTVWNKTKAVIKDKVGSVGIGLLVEVLKQQAKQMLGVA